MSSFPVASILDIAQAASQRRFQMFLLQSQREENDRQISALKDLMQTEIDAQQKIIDLQVDSTNKLAEAFDQLNETQDDLLKFSQEESDRNSKAQSDLTDAIDRVQKALKDAIKTVGLVSNWYAARKKSAGGLVIRPDESQDVKGADGFPFPTGSMMLSFNSMPVGWFPCNGNELPVQDFPELFLVIGNAYGAPTQSGRGFFKLPDTTDLPTVPTTDANGRPRWWIRT